MAFESRDELSLIRALDMAPQVPWFCEQPAAIGYIFAGRHRTYYPDLLAATRDGYCILIEVKPAVRPAGDWGRWQARPSTLAG